MRHSRPIHTYVEVIVEPQEPLAHELGAVIRDDRIWDSEPLDYVGEELHGLLGLDLDDRSRLDPFGELVHRYQQVGVAPGHSLQWSDKVQSPHSEGPCNGNGLQSMSREVRLTGVELATFAGSYNLRGLATAVGQ